jgi:hypothetical protein
MNNIKQRAASTNKNQAKKKKITIIITESQLRRLIDHAIGVKLKFKENNNNQINKG